APKLLELSPGEYSPQDSGYSIRFPAAPVSIAIRAVGAYGNLVFNTLALKGTDIEYDVGYADFPPIANDTEREYEGYKQGRVDMTGALLESEKELTLKGIVGREYVFRVRDYQQISRLYYVDYRMYLLTIYIHDKASKSKEMNQFFSSFKLIPK